MNTLSKHSSEFLPPFDSAAAARKRTVTIQALVLSRRLRALALMRSRRALGVEPSPGNAG